MDFPCVLADDPIRTCPEIDMPKLILRVDAAYVRLVKRSAPQIAVIQLADVYNLTSAARFKSVLASADGKLALHRTARDFETVIARHRRIYPYLMREMFGLMAEGNQSPDSDLAGRFATAVAELDLAAFPMQPIKPRLLKLLGNVDEGQYIRVVQDSAWQYATRRMAELLRGRSGGQDIAAQFEMERDSAAFTNWLLTPERVSPIYAQEILNAVELAGYEVDALDIQHAVIERAKITECDLQFD